MFFHWFINWFIAVNFDTSGDLWQQQHRVVVMHMRLQAGQHAGGDFKELW